MNADPVGTSAKFAVAALALTLFLTMGQLVTQSNGFWVDQLPHIGVIPLLIGATIFPRRLLFVPFAVYVVGFVLATLLRVAVSPDYLPSGLIGHGLVVASMLVNAAFATAAALIGRYAVRAAQKRDWWLKSDLVPPTATTTAYALVTLIMVPVVVFFIYPDQTSAPAWSTLQSVEAGILRGIRISLFAGSLMLVLLDVPRPEIIRLALKFLPVFVLQALLRNAGFYMHPTVDPMLTCIAVALLVPGYAAIIAVLWGMIAYMGLTSDFLVQIPLETKEIQRLEFISLILIVLTYVLFLRRFQSQIEKQRSREAIARLQRVQSNAIIGYFAVDMVAARIRFDKVGREIMGCGDEIGAIEFVSRVRPADRSRLAAATIATNDRSAVVHFTLTPAAEWDEGADHRYVAAHVWYERLWDERHVAYGAIIDLTEEHRRETALANALSTLSEQQARQTQLFSIVSHEIRTPASVISMLVEELDQGAKWGELGPRMRAVSEQLLSVLADMRQTVRPEENLPIRLEAFRPQALAETVRNTLLLMAEAKGITIELQLTAAAQDRISDRVRLAQALLNLVKNAILHSGCSRITLSYDEDRSGGGLTGVWRVSDNGQGIPPATRANLFEPFSRGRQGTTTSIDGSGLGLYITKSAIELLGGTVECLDAKPSGVEFCLRVPLTKAKASQTNRAPSIEKLQAQLAGKSVLLVEDSELIGELLVARLKRLFGRVDWVKDGAAGLTAAQRDRPDVILTDLFMPELGGDDMTATLRGLGLTTPIIGMTAAAIGDERTKFEGAGTDFVLTKPVSNAQLAEVLWEIVEGD